jgi:TPR repeat protein
VVRNASEAMQWFAKGAKAGDPESQFELGLAYFSGDGLTKSPTLTAWWWEKSALQGHVPSACNLGNLYNTGVGVGKDSKKAFFWTAKAAQQGDKFAQFNLSQMYRSGEGVPEDEQQRYQWLRAAAEGGHVPAYLELGALLYTSPHLRADGPPGLHWVRKAAEAGITQAAVLLFMSHATNAEGAPDIVESYAWGMVAAFLTARAEGDEKGKSTLGMLALIHDSLSEEQREQARVLARRIISDISDSTETN